MGTCREEPMQSLIDEAVKQGAQVVWKKLTAAKRLDFDIWLQESKKLQAHLPGSAWDRFEACVQEEKQ